MKKLQIYLTSRIQKDPKHSLFSQHFQCMSPYGFEKQSIKKIYLNKEVRLSKINHHLEQKIIYNLTIREMKDQIRVSIYLCVIQRLVGDGSAVDIAHGYVVKLDALPTTGSILSHRHCRASLYRPLCIPPYRFGKRHRSTSQRLEGIIEDPINSATASLFDVKKVNQSLIVIFTATGRHN